MSRPAPNPAEPAAVSRSGGGMAQAASLIALGNVLSRLLGLVRETVIASLFGATGLVSAFRVAQIIPVMLYDLLVGGMVSSAFVPVFSEQAEKDRTELWHIASVVISLATVVLIGVVLLIELAAPQVARLMAGGFDDALLAETARLIRITTPAVFFLSLSGIFTGLLHSLRRFTLPAFTASVFNATIVVVALVGALIFNWGIDSLAVGLLLGAALQVALQLPGLRDARLRPQISFRHPVLRRIIKLGLPVLLGLVISQVAIALDRNLASRTGAESIAWMQYATTIIQFPLGLVAAAISLAILPTLSRQAAQVDPGGRPLEAFSNTLAGGLRMVLVLIIPATVALFVLAEPVVSLLFERGQFTPADTLQTALALRIYLLGLTFAAIDQPLIFAYYARQNTLTPALVGLAGVGFYLAAALSPTLFRPLRMTDLVLANSVQLTGHALVMLWLVNRQSPLTGRQLGSTTLKAMAAALVMGGVLLVGLSLLPTYLPGDGLRWQALRLGILVMLGGGAYVALAALLRVGELKQIQALVLRILRKR